MAETRFDVLLRQAAQQTTRREAVATLLGGALLLNTPDAGEATKEAEHRKDRHHDGPNKSALLKDISFWVDNRAGTKAISIVYGGWNFPGFGCVEKGRTLIAAGDTRRLFTNKPGGYMMI